MRYSLILVGLVFILLITACGGGNQEKITTPQTIEEVLAITNLRRKITPEPDIDRLLALIDGWWYNPNIDWTRFINDNRQEMITREEAEYDAKAFFELLRYVYGAYNYFGGDETFLPLLDDVLQTIAQRWEGQEVRSIIALSQILWENIPLIIADNHFVVDNSWRPFASANYFVWDAPFDRTENGLRKRDTGLYVVNVDGYEKDEIFRLTINEAGEFFYTAVVVRLVRPGIGEDSYSLNVTFDDGSFTIVDLTPEPFIPSFTQTNTSWREHSLRFVNEIPVVSIRSMNNPFQNRSGDYRYAQQVLSFAEELRDEPVVIIDLRGNIGGHLILNKMFLHALLGELVPSNSIHISTVSNIYLESVIELPPGTNPPQSWGNIEEFEDFYFPHDIYDFYYPKAPVGNYHYIYIPDSRVVPNDKLIILLIDRVTASGGEDFTFRILNIENTLVIGENTSGTHLTKNNRNLYLPNSGMPTIMGELVIHPEGQWQEGTGIAPDIWVIGDSLTAALAMLENR